MKSISALVLMSFMTVVAGCGQATSSEKIHDEAMGESGVLHFELDADKPLALGMNNLQITIHDVKSDAPLTGAKIELSAMMPAMGHEAPTLPPLKETSAGIYEARDISLTMAGRWEIHIDASQTNPLDSATFDYDVR